MVPARPAWRCSWLGGMIGLHSFQEIRPLLLLINAAEQSFDSIQGAINEVRKHDPQHRQCPHAKSHKAKGEAIENQYSACSNHTECPKVGRNPESADHYSDDQRDQSQSDGSPDLYPF